MYAQAAVTGEEAVFYITSSNGRTIYSFANDTQNKNNFTNDDFSNNASWPIVEITIDKLPSTLNADEFGSIDVFGRTQLTFKGRPLYYFGGDNKRGDANGVSAAWPIVNNQTTPAPNPVLAAGLKVSL